MTGFLNALVDQRRQETLADGLKALVILYYEEYTDATELEDSMQAALRKLETEFAPFAPSVDLEEIVAEAEADVRRDTARNVRTWNTDDDEPQTRPCQMRLSTLGSQWVCGVCGDECECYVCTHDDETKCELPSDHEPETNP
jgi:hypothetical protein